MTANQLAYWNLQETKRSNEARERETQRHNVADEKLKGSATTTKAFTDSLGNVAKILKVLL